MGRPRQGRTSIDPALTCMHTVPHCTTQSVRAPWQRCRRFSKPVQTLASQTPPGTEHPWAGPNTTWPRGRMPTRRGATARSPITFVLAARIPLPESQPMAENERAPFGSPRAMRGVGLRMTQPEEMKTTAYVYGVEKLNGYDAWALFKACAAGDMPKVMALVAKDRRLVNAQFWYQFPIHMAVRAGHAEIVKLLLDQGADPGQSRFTHNSWDQLLLCANERGHRPVETVLRRAMT